MNGLFYAGRQMYLSMSQVESIIDPSSSPVGDYMKIAEQEGRLIKINRGKKPRSLIIMKTGNVYVSALSLRTLWLKFQQNQEPQSSDQDNDE